MVQSRRSASGLFLLELLLVILFFSLSSVVMLRLFVAAHQHSQEAAQVQEALEWTQDTAERWYAQGEAAMTDNWTKSEQDGTVIYRCYRNRGGDVCEPEAASYRLELRLTSREGDALEEGELLVEQWTGASEGAELCRLSLARYTPVTEKEAQP